LFERLNFYRAELVRLHGCLACPLPSLMARTNTDRDRTLPGRAVSPVL
jgi:hypothetical protein